ncbi:MAG: hypothetical protein KAW39_09185 [Thermoplasmata archaeon]|nr:hypothetical protein [Thermoplasmata archaeon]
MGIALAVSAMLFQAASAGAPLPGAIFTSLEDGTMVNANHYADKRDVYLNGGPGPHAPPHAAGLPDGNYYFQVTDPSGKKLLSEDPAICREFRVEDGVIAEYVSIGRTYTVQKGNGNGPTETFDCYQEGWEFGMHDLGWNLWADSLTIQLMPYKDTPNKGGVYKVWATPIGFYLGDPNDLDPGYEPGNYHGFVPAHSKTDNFKAKSKGGPLKPTPEIEICKFEDMNGNGLWDEGELGIPGWAMFVTDPLGVVNTVYTGEDGCIVIDAPVDGDYLIEEETPSGWSATATIVDGEPAPPTNPVTISVDYKVSLTYSVAFGNFNEFDVWGHKYNDLNGDGDWDVGEPGIEGWEITLERSTDGGTTWSTYATTTTDTSGYYSFTATEPGEYRVSEEDRVGWVHTSDASFSFTAVSGVGQGPFDFYNFQCFSVSGYKYEDMNGDGDWDEGDTGLEGWTITLYRMDADSWVQVATTTTDASGYYEFEICMGGEYKVAETEMEGWMATAPTEFTFTAVSGQAQTFDFFNFELGEVCGAKWYDVDKDGVMDEGEEIIEGFMIELWKDSELVETVYTDANGEYCFTGLGAGSYEVKEIMPNAPGEYYVWANTYPGDGHYMFDGTSGFFMDDADFGNVVEFTGGLTWGYWKTHTGHGAPPRDPAYDLLPDYPMAVDVPTPDNDYEVDSDDEAKWIFDGAGDYPANCAGTCRSLFRAQLLALHMNLLKFGTDMADAVYIFEGDDYSGWTVQEVYDEALWKLLNEDGDYDFTSFQETLDNINNNHNEGTGDHTLVLPEAPTIEYP